jgi:hypothetical protein
MELPAGIAIREVLTKICEAYFGLGSYVEEAYYEGEHWRTFYRSPAQTLETVKVSCELVEKIAAKDPAQLSMLALVRQSAINHQLQCLVAYDENDRLFETRD